MFLYLELMKPFGGYFCLSNVSLYCLHVICFPESSHDLQHPILTHASVVVFGRACDIVTHRIVP